MSVLVNPTLSAAQTPYLPNFQSLQTTVAINPITRYANHAALDFAVTQPGQQFVFLDIYLYGGSDTIYQGSIGIYNTKKQAGLLGSIPISIANPQNWTTPPFSSFPQAQLAPSPFLAGAGLTAPLPFPLVQIYYPPILGNDAVTQIAIPFKIELDFNILKLTGAFNCTGDSGGTVPSNAAVTFGNFSI